MVYLIYFAKTKPFPGGNDPGLNFSRQKYLLLLSSELFGTFLRNIPVADGHM